MDVRLTTLGTPGVQVGATSRPSLPGKPVSFGLLVYLGAEGEATRDRLTSLFWPESPQEKARHALSQALYELRQDLGDTWIESTGNLLRTTPALWIDAREFEALLDQGRAGEALDLYEGHFLAGVHLVQTHEFEDWAGHQRSHLGRRHRAAADAFIQERKGQGDLESALDRAWKWVRLDPLDDGGQHYLIELLAETGSRTEALAQFERYRALLESELALTPLEDTLELVEAIRSGQRGPTSSWSPLSVPSYGEGSSPPQPEPSSTLPPPPDPPGRTEPKPEADQGGLWPAPPGSGMEGAGIPDSGPGTTNLRKVIESNLPSTFQLLRSVGQGTMSEVFLARDVRLKRLVAIKVLLPHLYRDERVRARFEREAQSAARINHPNVCNVLTVGSLGDGTPFLVYPFVKGTTLKERLKAEGRLGTEEVRKVIRETASALAAAHRLGIIHRDLRPDNVLREEDTGRHYLSDFGIAGVLDTGDSTEPKITMTGEVLGHPAYISPEQLDGLPLTDRSDVYSLGIMAHELLTGHPPLHRDRGPEGGKSSVIPSDLGPLREYLAASDPDLVDLITRCLATDPASRPAAVDIVRKCEDRALEAELQSAAPDFLPARAGRLLSPLIERRFFQIIGAYVAGGWVFIEATDQLESRGYLPEPAYQIALATGLFGFLATNVLAWYHGRKGRQRMPGLEKAILGMLVVGWISSCVLLLSG